MEPARAAVAHQEAGEAHREEALGEEATVCDRGACARRPSRTARSRTNQPRLLEMDFASPREMASDDRDDEEVDLGCDQWQTNQ